MWISATSHLQASKLQTNDYRVKRIFFIPLTPPSARDTIRISCSTPGRAFTPGRGLP
jgi:hypothetical protein